MDRILRNISILNIILLVLIALMAYSVVSPLFGSSARYTPPQAQKAALPDAGQPVREETPQIPDYAIIAEKNLFNPERRIPVEVAGVAEAKPLPKPEFVLYGTLITDECAFAYIKDRKNPRSTPGRGDRLTVVRKGDAISGFTVQSIGPDRVVLARGDEMMAISVSDTERKGR